MGINLLNNFTQIIDSFLVRGRTDGVAPSAGMVGEPLTSLPTATSLAFSDDTFVNITSLTLSAGTWTVWGQSAFTQGTGSGLQYVTVAISTESSGIDTSRYLSQVAASGVTPYTATPHRVITVATTTTIYLIARAKITTPGTCTFRPDQSFMQAIRIA